eukprot:GFUD01006517.1.p1 GENE.GFUD01006517.1~~GFUD01006517.1.p1  ORF type:complete len:450 (-),score=94.93 GFUD01006517.1:111-1406(-)
MAYLPFFLLLCAFPISSTSPTLAESSTYTDTNTPTLSEAVRIIQVNAITALNEKIAEQEILIKNKEDESRVLKNVIEQQMSGLDTQFKDSGVLVKFMMTVLEHSEEVMILRENMIAAQGKKLQEYKNQNEVLMKNQELQTEIITNQNKAKANIKQLLVTDKQLISSYKETEASKPSGNCELVPFIAGLANTLSQQKTEIRNLKTVLKTEAKIAEHLEKMAEEMTKLSNEESDWDAAINYQTIIKTQSNGIRQVTTLANFIKMSGLPFMQDDAGNIIPIAGHPQCMMDYTTWTEDWRMVSYSTQRHAADHCDLAPASSINTGFTSGWHRFVFNGVDARIPTHAPASQYYQGYGQTCGTYGASWMDGSLPSLGEPPKDVTIKFSGGGQAEYSTKFRKPAKVVACLDENYQTFYLYHLVQVYQCNLAYCATTEF